jgi:hypothetical protein
VVQVWSDPNEPELEAFDHAVAVSPDECKLIATYNLPLIAKPISGKSKQRQARTDQRGVLSLEDPS